MVRHIKTAVCLLLIPYCAAAQLAVLVRDSVSKQPVPRARLVVSGPKSGSASADDLGEIHLDGAPLGKYVLNVSANGYDAGRITFELKPAAEPVTVELKPWGEVDGQILDEDGRPIEGVRIYLGGLHDTTGKDGRYHATAITSGTYNLTVRLPYELRRKTAIRDDKSSETKGYPGTIVSPVPLTVPPGARMSNIDFHLRRTLLIEIRSRVTGALPETEVELAPGSNPPDETYNSRRLEEHGGFHFDLLEPGVHTLIVHRKPGDDLPYFTPATPDLDVVLPPFVTIEGIVHPERPELAWEGPFIIGLEHQGYATQVHAGPEGRFVLQNVPPGEWALRVDDKLVRMKDSPEKPLYATNLPGSTIMVTESGNRPLEITLTDRTGHITGTAASGAMVTLAQAAGRMLLIQAQPDGTFAREVPPGEYRVSCDMTSEKVNVPPAGSATVRLTGCLARE